MCDESVILELLTFFFLEWLAIAYTFPQYKKKKLRWLIIIPYSWYRYYELVVGIAEEGLI